MARYELTDAQWDRIAYFFPHPTHWAGAGHPWHPHRPLVNGILWHLHTGAPWRDVPAQYGPWQTVYDRFNGWRKDGTWARILTTLLDQLDDAGRISRELWCIDASVIRASRAAAGARKQPAPYRVHWAATRRRNSKSQKTMRWDVRGEALAPRCT